MNILLIGGGGREHALAWKLKQSPELKTLYCAPGNAGTLAIAKPAAIDAGDREQVAGFCRAASIDLVVIGPEAPLVAGLADELREAGIAVFGPSKAAAQLEASKSFTKAVCDARGIPTAAYGYFQDRAGALAYVRERGAPLVVKADGLAAGKGVLMCETLAGAEDAIEACFSGAFGESGASVVIEEMLVGEECSFFALCDGTRALPLASAQDYKRAFDGDTGLNTGGMGAISPAPMMTPALSERVMREIIAPTLDEMRERGTPFQGVLYAGLMITADGPKLIEYNTRFGDPECQVLMMRLKSDLALTLMAAAKGDLSRTELEWTADAALTVVMAANGYPGDYRKGTVIGGLAEAGDVEGVTIFHAGTAPGSAGETLAAGGRVLNVSATGKDAGEARERAYRAIGLIDWPGGFQARHRLALAQPGQYAMMRNPADSFTAKEDPVTLSLSPRGEGTPEWSASPDEKPQPAPSPRSHPLADADIARRQARQGELTRDRAGARGSSSALKPRAASIGLALGGGGARGLAHIAILEAFDELGVKPAMIAGTSIGALIGAAYASGMSAAEIRSYCQTAFARRSAILRHFYSRWRGRIWDFWRPGSPALFKSERIFELVLPADLPKTFESLKIPFKSVAADFFSQSEYVCESGPLLPAIAASAALPALLTPVKLGGRVLIDGGFVNPLPFDLLTPHASFVIACDVSGGASEERDGFPRPMETLLGAQQLALRSIVNAKLKSSRPHLLVRPAVGQFRVLDFRRMDEILAASEAAKAEVLRGLAGLLETSQLSTL